jgi:hypothetical protein
MNLFNENTYKRLSVINKRPLQYSDTILKYLKELPPIIHVTPKYTKIIQKAPLKAIIESRFARFDSILRGIKMLKTKCIIDLDPHVITIYGNDISSIYIYHVASIVTWWAKIKPQKYIITLYLTNIKKRLPPDNKPNILTEEYMNSGFTFVMDPCDIHIFRREESLKVLIHELIHASKCDFNGNHLVDVPVELKDEDISNEGITEYLAIIHYYWYVSNVITKNIDLTYTCDQFIELLSNDLGWQHYQISKILKYFELKPSDLLDKNNFKQKTSVMSYFFLKNYLFTQNSLPIILSRNVNDINKLIINMRDYFLNFDVESVMDDAISMRMSLYELTY